MNEENKCGAGCELLEQEFRHLRRDWWWLFLYGVLLVICGMAAIIFPAISTVIAMIVLAVVLIIAGVATIIHAFWAGKWSGMLGQLFVGILYLVLGIMIQDKPIQAGLTLTLIIAAFFIVVGGFRIVSSLAIRFPYWGWSLLNGIITFLLGLVIYRLFEHGPKAADLWVLGLLIGIEMLFHGWTWIMLSLAVHHLPAKTE